MPRERLASGAVIRYPFLGKRESLGGETEGRKTRPTVVGFHLEDGLLLPFPISTRPLESERFCREVPDTEKRLAGLDFDRRSWILLDEINTDHFATSVYLEPDCRIGRFSRAFTLQVFRAWVEERRARKIAISNRRG